MGKTGFSLNGNPYKLVKEILSISYKKIILLSDQYQGVILDMHVLALVAIQG
jgi:hypothetical protein